MDGILEKILGELQAIRQQLASGAAQQPASGAPQQQLGPGTQVGTAAAQVTETGQPITADTLTALITPHVGNPAIKDELGVEMRKLGVNAFPETPPHLFPQMYQAFKHVIAKHTGGGAATQVQTSASII